MCCNQLTSTTINNKYHKPYEKLVSICPTCNILLGVYLVSWAEAHRKDGVARQRQGLLDFSVSFCVYLWEAFHLYNKSSPGRAVSGYEKGAKTEMMSDSHGKNRSYVKINLSVVQHLLHKTEEKKKKENTCERMFFPSEALSRDPLSVLCDTARRWNIQCEVLRASASEEPACAAWQDPGKRWNCLLKPQPFLVDLALIYLITLARQGTYFFFPFLM